jgi:hypothetical protein
MHSKADLMLRFDHYAHNGVEYDFNPETCPFPNAAAKNDACAIDISSDTCDTFDGIWLEANDGLCIVSTNTLDPVSAIGGADHQGVDMSGLDAPYFMFAIGFLAGIGLLGSFIKGMDKRGDKKVRRDFEAAEVENEYSDLVDEKIARAEIRQV